MKNGFVIIQWLFGIIFLISGVGNILSLDILAGLFFFLAGLLLVPPIRFALAKRYTILRSKFMRIVILLGCLFGAGIFSDSSNREDDASSQVKTPLLPESQPPREISPEEAAARKQANLKRAEVRKKEAEERKRLVQEKEAKDGRAKIDQLLGELKAIPAALTHANLSRYQQLTKLDPANDDFKAKFQIYADRLSEPLNVIGIPSAETVTLLTADKKQLKTYLYGVDAPEPGQEFSSKAKVLLSDLIKKGNQQLRFEQVSREGEIPVRGRLYLPDYSYLNEMMIAEGGAWARSDAPAETDLHEAQKIAQNKQLGLWASEAAPMSPPEYRKRRQVALRQEQARRKAPQPVDRKVDTSKDYWLNTKTGKRHNKGCRWFGRTGTGRYCPSNAGVACGICKG